MSRNTWLKFLRSRERVSYTFWLTIGQCVFQLYVFEPPLDFYLSRINRSELQFFCGWWSALALVSTNNLAIGETLSISYPWSSAWTVRFFDVLNYFSSVLFWAHPWTSGSKLETTLIECFSNFEIVSGWYFLIFGSVKHRNDMLVSIDFQNSKLQNGGRWFLYKTIINTGNYISDKSKPT